MHIISLGLTLRILAISGSVRHGSSNLALLRALKHISPAHIEIIIFEDLAKLPIFSPDLEGDDYPVSVKNFIHLVAQSDGIIISSPEYVRAIPGGLKNAFDWLVSTESIINKPIVLLHASHRGDDMLASLRLVLKTITAGFNEDIFARFPLMSKSSDDIRAILSQDIYRNELKNYLSDFIDYIQQYRSVL